MASGLANADGPGAGDLLLQSSEIFVGRVVAQSPIEPPGEHESVSTTRHWGQWWEIEFDLSCGLLGASFTQERHRALFYEPRTAPVPWLRVDVGDEGVWFVGLPREGRTGSLYWRLPAEGLSSWIEEVRGLGSSFDPETKPERDRTLEVVLAALERCELESGATGE